MTAALRRRLNKLEALRTDSAGPVPLSQQWLAYWTERIGELERDSASRGRWKIPLEAVDAIIAWQATP